MSEPTNWVSLDISCTEGDTRNLIIKYPVTGTRRSHLVAMEERAEGRASFREFEDSEHCQCIEIHNLPIQEIESNNENNSRTIHLEDSTRAQALHAVIKLGHLSGNCVEGIPLKMSRDDWTTVLQVPLQDVTRSLAPRPARKNNERSWFNRCQGVMDECPYACPSNEVCGKRTYGSEEGLTDGTKIFGATKFVFIETPAHMGQVLEAVVWVKGVQNLASNNRDTLFAFAQLDNPILGLKGSWASGMLVVGGLDEIR